MIKKIIVAALAVIFIVSAFCVVSSAASSGSPNNVVSSVETSGVKTIRYNVKVNDIFVYYDPTLSGQNYSEFVDHKNFKFIQCSPGTSVSLRSSSSADIYETSSRLWGETVISAFAFSGPGVVSLSVEDGEASVIHEYYITDGSSVGFITSVLYSFTELFSGLTKGLAGVSVSAADSLILNSDGSLTSFSQIGIVFIGIELVLAVIFFLVRRIR